MPGGRRPSGGLGQEKKNDMRTQFLKLPDLEETLNQGFPKSLKKTLVWVWGGPGVEVGVGV